MKVEKKKVRVSRSRQVNTYAEMWHASDVMLDMAEKDVEGSYYTVMASLIFTSFTLEAYLNHIGKQVFACWDDLERLSPQGKMNVIAEKLGVKMDKGRRPFQTVSKLFDFRNNVAHGKTIPLKLEDIINAEDNDDKYLHELLKAEWSKYCTLDNAKLARKDVESIIRKFHDASGITDDILFNTGIQFGQATVMHEGQD